MEYSEGCHWKGWPTRTVAVGASTHLHVFPARGNTPQAELHESRRSAFGVTGMRALRDLVNHLPFVAAASSASGFKAAEITPTI